MIENVSEVIQKYLNEEGYKILKVDEDGFIRIRYQMTEVCIVPNSNVKNFVSVLIPEFDQMDSEDPMPYFFRCMRLVSTQLVVKVYPVDKETIIATYEFFFNNEEDLCFQISKGLDALMDVSRRYRLLKREDEEEARQKAEKGDDDDNEDEGWEEVDGADDEPQE